tara:strand:+ start:2457 stop:5315 length:2859 start_codon:yes stop_codon:yes gene_type:complete
MSVNALDKDVQHGIKAHKAGRIQEAESSYKAILKIQPKHPDVNHNMGVLLVGLKKAEKALTFFEIAVKATPNKVQFWLSYIEALISLEQNMKAHAVMKQAKNFGARGPNFDKLEQQLLTLQKVSAKNKLPPKKGVFELKTLKLDQAHKLAKRKVKDGLDLEAKLIYQTILEKFPSNKIAKDRLKFLNSKISSVNTKAHQEPSKNQQQSLVQLFQEKKFKPALDQCSQLLKFFPNSIFLGNIQGAIFKALGRFEDAIKVYEKVLTIAPNSPTIIFNMGVTFLAQGDLEAAIEAQTKVLEINPNYAEAQFNIGEIFKRRGRLEQAVDAFKKATIIKPNYVDAFFNMANTLSNQGRRIEAIEAYEKVLKLKPDHAGAKLNIGVAFKEQGNTEKAIKCFEHLLIDRPNYTDAHFNLGDTYAKQGAPRMAINALKKVLFIDPNHAQAHNSMGNALLEIGETENAVDAYKKAIAIRPDFKPAWENIVFPLQILKLNISSDKELCCYFPGDAKTSSKLERASLNYKLSRGGPNSAEALSNVLELLSITDGTTIQKPQKKGEASISPVHVINKVVALKHFGRSGTGLLHSLIDGHSAISTLPSIYLSQYFDQATWDKIISDGWDNMVDRFIELYDVLFDARSSVPFPALGDIGLQNFGVLEGMTKLGGNKDEFLSVDKSSFRKEFNLSLNSFNEIDQATFFKLVHVTYEKVLNKTSNHGLIFYHIHNPSPDAELKFIQSVADMSWMVMVREPVQSYESWIRKSFAKGRYEELAQKLRAMLFEIDNISYSNNVSIGVKLEDLKRWPHKTINAICDWLKISEENSLYEMTAQKKKWWGDPTSPDFSEDGMNPFGITAINRKVGTILSKKDQFILRTLFYPFSVRFGYNETDQDQFENDLQCIRPYLEKMFDFEKVMLKNLGSDPEEFLSSGPCISIRSTLIERWNTLHEFGTYRNLLTPLKI